MLNGIGMQREIHARFIEGGIKCCGKRGDPGHPFDLKWEADRNIVDTVGLWVWVAQAIAVSRDLGQDSIKYYRGRHLLVSSFNQFFVVAFSLWLAEYKMPHRSAFWTAVLCCGNGPVFTLEQVRSAYLGR